MPREGAVEEAYERKKLRYAELAADAQQKGWKAKVGPVEVGRRGFVPISTSRLLGEYEGRPTDRQSRISPGLLRRGASGNG